MSDPTPSTGVSRTTTPLPEADVATQVDRIRRSLAWYTDASAQCRDVVQRACELIPDLDNGQDGPAVRFLCARCRGTVLRVVLTHDDATGLRLICADENPRGVVLPADPMWTADGRPDRSEAALSVETVDLDGDWLALARTTLACPRRRCGHTAPYRWTTLLETYLSAYLKQVDYSQLP